MLSLHYHITGLARKLLCNRVGSMRGMSTIVELREEVRNRSNAPQGNSACQVRLNWLEASPGRPRALRSQETVMLCRLSRFSCRKLPTQKEVSAVSGRQLYYGQETNSNAQVF